MQYVCAYTHVSMWHIDESGTSTISVCFDRDYPAFAHGLSQHTTANGFVVQFMHVSNQRRGLSLA